MDILELAEKWAQREEAVAKAIKRYQRGHREPLLKLFDSYKKKQLPQSLHEGIRSLLQKKRGAPSKISPTERFNRLNMAICVNAFHKCGDTIEVATERVAALFCTSDSIVKHAYLKQFPKHRASHSRSRNR